MMDFSSPRQPRSCVWAWPGESSEVVLRPLKNQSSSAGVPVSPTTLARPVPGGSNTAYTSLLCGTRESASGRTMAAGAGRDTQLRLRARVRTAPWEARAQLILAMETGAVLEASGQLLVGPHPSSGGSSQPTTAGEMWSQDALASPLPCGDSRYVRPLKAWDFVAALVSTPGYYWVPSAFNTLRSIFRSP